MPISINQAYPLGLIINELISNSMKYAFPEDKTGEMAFKMKKLENELELTVKDDGIELPKGFDWKNTKSLGLKLVRTFVENQLLIINTKNGT
jgi:two-component sensor histidine kinase